MTLEGRVAIVTGSGGGLGRAHVRYLASRGARVVQGSEDRIGTQAEVALA